MKTLDLHVGRVDLHVGRVALPALVQFLHVLFLYRLEISSVLPHLFSTIVHILKNVRRPTEPPVSTEVPGISVLVHSLPLRWHSGSSRGSFWSLGWERGRTDARRIFPILCRPPFLPFGLERADRRPLSEVWFQDLYCFGVLGGRHYPEDSALDHP